MQTFPLIAILIGGIVCLYLGAQLLIVYASRFAISLGLSPLIVGLTVVAFSTSTPELASTLVAQLQGQDPNIVMGAIVGSNVANIGLILSLITLIKPLDIKPTVKNFEAPMTTGLALLLWVLMLRGKITRGMGIFLVIGIILYTYKHITTARREGKQKNENKESIKGSRKVFYFILIVLGVAFLTAGGVLLINGAVALGRKLGVSERLIGLSVVAVGTSLPEFAASLVAIFRKLGDVAIGNILGSNVFNILFILGVVAIVKPITFAPKFLNQDVPLLIAISVLLWILLCRGKKLSRFSGLLLFLCYLGYLYLIY